MGLYRLQVSQHQLQKDVTHQLSCFLVNRRDDETDFSDMVHIFFAVGFSVMASSFHRCKTKSQFSLLSIGEANRPALLPGAGLRLMTLG